MSEQPEPEKAFAAVEKPEEANQFTDQTNRLPTRQIILVFLGIAACGLLATLDATIIATALPSISAHFNAGSTISWLPAANALTGTVFQPVFGRLSDIFGRKYTLLVTMSLFAIGNLAAGFSTTIVQLIVFRAIGGMGSGSMLGLGPIIISDVVSLRERGKYQGVIGGIMALGYAIGPPLGGVLAEKAGWRWCFWVTVPLCVFALAVVMIFLPLIRVEGGMKRKLMAIDYMGAILSLAGFTLIILPINWGGVMYPWVSAIVLAPLFSGAFLVLFFVLWEWKFPIFPLVPLHIFKHVTVCGVYLTNFVSGIVSSTSNYYIPQFFQVNQNYSPIHSGLLLLPLLLSQSAVSFITGQIISRTGHYRFIIWSGFSCLAIGCGCISTWNSHSSLAVIIIFQLISGIGFGQTFQSTTLAAQASVSRRDMAVVTSVRNFFRNLGSSFSLVIGASILNNGLKSAMSELELPPATILQIINDPTSLHSGNLTSVGITPNDIDQILSGYTRGFRSVFILNASLAVASVVVAIFMIRHKNLTREEDAELKKKAKERLAKNKVLDAEAGVVEEKHNSEDRSGLDVPSATETRTDIGEEIQEADLKTPSH